MGNSFIELSLVRPQHPSNTDVRLLIGQNILYVLFIVRRVCTATTARIYYYYFDSKPTGSYIKIKAAGPYGYWEAHKAIVNIVSGDIK